ncbi:MAG: MFS transporter [Chloroflexi bacterium]|nr:MFS transporter [Chloroflexota bacterium]
MPLFAENKYVALLRDNPDYRKLYFGQIVSLLGDWFEFIAVQTLVFQLTGSGLAAGLAIIASTLPSFFLIPLAGSIADRFDRRKIMIAMDLVRAVLALSLLLVRTADQIWMVYVFQTLSVVFASFFNPALNAAMPNLVRREQLLTANALSSATWGTMLAVGALIGGVAVATVGRDMAFVLNSLSFLGSTFFVWRIRTVLNQLRAAAHKPLNPFADFVEGFQYAVQRPQVFWLLLVKAGGGLAGGVILLLTVFSFQVFEMDAQGVGLLQFARGIGILVGPFVVARFVNGRIGRAQHFISIGFFVVGASYLLFGLAPTIFVAMACVFFAHTGWGSNWTLSAVLLQRLTPDYIRGRIFSMDLGMLTLTLAFSTFITGAATDRSNPHLVAYMLSATFVLFGLVWTLGVWLSQHRVPQHWQDGLISAARVDENAEPVLMGVE